MKFKEERREEGKIGEKKREEDKEGGSLSFYRERRQREPSYNDLQRGGRGRSAEG